VVQLLNYRPELLAHGNWEVVIQAGVHKDKLRSVGQMNSFTARLVVRGEMSGTTRLSTIDGTGTSNAVGIWFEPGLYCQIKDLNIGNFRSPATEGDDEPDTGAGIVQKGGGDAIVTNVNVYNCSQGIGAINSTKMLVTASLIDGCATNVRVLYGSSAQIGTSSQPNVISNATKHGVFVSRNAVAHVDYNTIDGNATGVQADMAARFAMLGGTVSNNDVGVAALSAAEMIVDPDTIFLNNGRDRLVSGLGREARVYSQEGKYNEFCMYRTVDAVTVSDTTKTALIFTGSVCKTPPRYFANKGQKIRLVINGNQSGTGTRAYQVQFRNPADNAFISTANFTIPAGKAGSFVGNIEIFAISPTSLQWTVEYRFHDSTPAIMSGTATVDSSYEWMFALYVTNGTSGDVTTMRQGEIYMQG
jgi:hypothetical protein